MCVHRERPESRQHGTRWDETTWGRLSEKHRAEEDQEARGRMGYRIQRQPQPKTEVDTVVALTLYFQHAHISYRNPQAREPH